MSNPLQPEIRSNFWPVEDSGGRIVVGRAPSAEYTGSADYRSCEYGRLDHRAAQLPDCCLRSTKRALRLSHKSQCRHADTDLRRKDSAQGSEAGKHSASCRKHVVNQQDVPEDRRSDVIF